MVTEEVTTLKVADLVFLNHYIANSSSSYYSGADYQRIQLQHFDPKKIQSYSSTNNVRLPLGDIFRSLIENHCPESNYIAFCEQVYGSAPKLVVMNAESNTVAYSLNSTTSKTFGNRARLYDHYLAISPENLTLEVIDIITNKKITRVFQQNYLFGFMTADTIVVHTRDELRPTKEDKIILWNFKDETEVVYPAGQVPFVPITMIYNDMWLVFHESKLAFFDMKDGTAINTLTLRDCHRISISLLSDGRLGLAQQSGCRVISFIDSEVNRKIKVKVMDIKGNETSHEISAHELPKFFVDEVKKPLEMIISRVVSYTSETATPPANNERFVLIFSQDEKNKSQPVNETATKLLGTATKPTNLHTPIQAWKFDEPKILNKDYIVDRVCGKAIIAREKKIDGRWQLISLN
jgi:WD40 repeat protein